GLREIADTHADLIRERFPDIPRRVSGYNLDSLLPEKGFNLAEALVGSEGTLVTVLGAELDLVPVVPETALLVLAYDDIQAAADAVPTILAHSDPMILEGLDDRLVYFEHEEHLNEESLQMLPEGAGWLLAQFGGDTAEEAHARADDLLEALGRSERGPRVTFSDDRAAEEEIWAAREAGLGATARPPDMSDSWPGWEDSAVDPECLGDYLRDLGRLFDEFDLGRPAVYGHFGQGCLHIRIPFDLVTAEGVATFARFHERVAYLVASYAGP